jgi:hypothetical protein
LSLAARRAGKIAARIPTITAAIAKMISWPTGSESTMKSTRAMSSDARTIPSAMPIVAPISAVMAHHPADLTPRHSDCAQHADLTGPFEDGQHKRVDDPEEADDDGQSEQHVKDVQDGAEP